MIEKNVEFQEVKICTEHTGNEGDPAILLMMGATASMLWWDEEFCEGLAERGFFVIRYDNRDVGKSTTYPQGIPPYTLEDMVHDAIGILDAYNIPQGHLVGMSLGGLLAQMAALMYEDRVASLTLYATGPFGPSDPDIPPMDERVLDFQAKATEVNWDDEEAVAAYLAEGAAMQSGSGHVFDKERGMNLAKAEFRRANNYISMFNHAGLQGGENLYGRVNEIQQPVLLIHGTEDPIWHYRHTKVLLEELKHAELLTLDGTGHELHRNDWDAIINAIAQHVLRST